MNKQHKCTCGASLTGLCKDSKICPEMNNKTAEEILKNEFIKGMVNKDFYSFSKRYPTLLKCQIKAMEEYASPLKKRIEELEACYEHYKNLYEQGLIIIEALHPSTNGKQD